MTLIPRAFRPTRPGRALCALFAAFGLLQPVRADEGPSLPRIPPLPVYRQECGTCHLAYPPGLLPGASWQRLMSNLAHHFGTDASPDAATAKEISAWLAANASAERRSGDAPTRDRITATAWFKRQHEEVPTAVWKHAAVTSAANCAACHTRADQGDFDEHNVRIPR